MNGKNSLYLLSVVILNQSLALRILLFQMFGAFFRFEMYGFLKCAASVDLFVLQIRDKRQKMCLLNDWIAFNGLRITWDYTIINFTVFIFIPIFRCDADQQKTKHVSTRFNVCLFTGFKIPRFFCCNTPQLFYYLAQFFRLSTVLFALFNYTQSIW